jgi:hypothetical protein
MKIIGKDIQMFPAFGGCGSRGSMTYLLAVLVEDNSGQYAVYVGGAPVDAVEKIDTYAGQVACSGAKMNFREAGFWFRDLEESKYRR